MIIKFQIVKSLVMEAVKAATYLKGKIDEATQQNAEKFSYNETAGDDEVHERTLERDFDTALEVLKTIFVDYIVPTPQTIGDNVIYYKDVKDDIVEFVLSVSRRYNGTLTDTLARLSARYVEDYMLYQWWVKTTNLKQAEPYAAALTADEAGIRKCFILSSPAVPKSAYTSTIVARVDGVELADGDVNLQLGEDYTLSYAIDDGTLDDIEAHSKNPMVVEIPRVKERFNFILHPVNVGITTITLFSRHDSTVKLTANIIVKEDGGNGA